MAVRKLIYQFRVTLLGIEPAIWRRIQVSENYTFWDLHVAIQDAMGWLDYHLHAFQIKNPHRRESIEIGIPDTDTGIGRDVLAGWEVPIADYFDKPGDAVAYDYDFGDSWQHEVLLEGILLKEPSVKYPVCMAGENACPPEDCGGIPGFERLLETLAHPKSKEYKETTSWLKGHVKNYFPYYPDRFDAAQVKFTNPTKRWKTAFGD
jgi:hypothetical protein